MNQSTECAILPWLTANDEVLLRIQKQIEHLASLRLPTPIAAWAPPPQALRSFIEVAFWASLITNEGRPTRVRIALAPRNLVSGAFTFASAVDFNAPQIAKLAHVVPSHGSLLVAPGTDRLQIWGFTGSPLGGGVDGITAKIAAAGLVLVNVHVLRPFAVFSGGSVFFLEGGVPVNLPDYLRRAMRKELVTDDVILLHQGWHECVALGVLAGMIVDHGHGGTLLIVPDVDGRWLDSLNPFAFKFATPDTTAQEWIRERLKDTHAHGEAFARIWSSSLSDADKMQFAAALSTRPWKPGEAVQHIAPLANCDGAIVATEDLRIIGFGAKIAVSGEGLEKLWRLNPLPGLQELTPCLIEDFGGTRHQSAARFVAAYKDTVAIVVSHDRRMSILNWSNEHECVLALEHAEWWA